MVFYSPHIVTVAVSVAVCEIFSVKQWRDLGNQVRSCSRSLKMAPFDRPYATFYWSAIVNRILSCTIFEFHTCFIPVGPTVWSWPRTQRTNPEIGPSRQTFFIEMLFKRVDVCCTDCFLPKFVPPIDDTLGKEMPSIVTMAVSVAVCEIFSVKEWCDLENRVRVRSRSLEMATFDRSHTSSYLPSILTIALSCIVCEI